MPLNEIHWYDTIDSTMHEAVRLASAGCASGTVVAAGEQTAGFGRYGRVWLSERGSGLYFSIVLRLPLEPASMPVVTLALGLATAEAVQLTSGAACDLRWPNDVLIRDRKCAGILTQLHGGAVVAGIGINVNHTELPPDLNATSLRVETGREHSREALLTAVLDAIHRHCDTLVSQGPGVILDLFTRASSYVAGRRVIVDESITGTTAGLTREGFLRLRRDDGPEETILAGGVRSLEGRPCC